MRAVILRAMRPAMIVGLLAYPLFLHHVLTTGRGIGVALLVLAAQAAALVAVATRSRGWRRWLLLAAVTLWSSLAWLSARLGLMSAIGAQHAFVHLSLLILFAGSLLPGRQPLVTWIALKVRGSLPGDMADYTRRVTWAWSAFFAAQLLTSLALFLLAQVEVWSLFVNVLDLPLVALMFGLEYAYRCRRFRHLTHGTIGDVVRVFRELWSTPAPTPVPEVRGAGSIFG